MFNYALCNQTFFEGLSNNNQTIIGYRYNGPVGGLYAGTTPPPMITYAGCVDLCGTGSDYYDWTQSSATISTWVLPIIGLFLQVPFESNEFWDTIFALLHWVGSPISSLAAVFWNIEVSNRCSLMVDMAVSYVRPMDTHTEAQYKDIRDAFYLLGVMNQYTVNRTLPRELAERLLRVTLFSDSLELKKPRSVQSTDAQSMQKHNPYTVSAYSNSQISGTNSLRQPLSTRDLRSVQSDDEIVSESSLLYRRARLAEFARRTRKRGVVPVLITLGWFVFSFAISVQQAFGQLGFAAQAHDLALGLLLAWVPIFTLSCVVDRNPTQSAAIRDDLNELIGRVREALTDKDILTQYMHSTGRPESSFEWIKRLNSPAISSGGFKFFGQFAGQGRLRWHYGIAHDILDGIEECYVLEHGRGWLEDSEEARNHLIMGPRNMPKEFTRKLNPKSVWQIICAILLIGLSCLGAGILSYFEPPQGLGCRSGGWLIFFVISMFVLVLELLFWAFIPKRSRVGVHRLSMAAAKVSWLKSDNIRTWFKETTTRDYLKSILILVELANTGWLVWVMIAQTFGFYRSCACEALLWDRTVGYLDFSSEQTYLDLGITTSWITGTAIVIAVMFIHFIYIIHEWCTQSHLNSSNYAKSQRGLARTRWYRSKIIYFQKILWFISDTLAQTWLKCSRGKLAQRKKTLRWTPDSSTPHFRTESTFGIGDLASPNRPSLRSPAPPTPGSATSFKDPWLTTKSSDPGANSSNPRPSYESIDLATAHPWSTLNTSGVHITGEHLFDHAMSRTSSVDHTMGGDISALGAGSAVHLQQRRAPVSSLFAVSRGPDDDNDDVPDSSH